MSLSDSTLINQFTSGNSHSFSILVDRYQKRVYGFIFSKVKDAELADDVFQDTFVKVIKNLRLGKYKDEGRFLSWVMRIAHNIIMDHFRKINRLPKHESKHEDLDVLDRLIEQSSSVEDLMIETQIHADLSILIDELPQTQKEVLRMRLFQEMSFKDIGEQTGVSINTALGRMRYAILNLRKLIDERNLIFTQ
ncbi:MAG: sigma-70 family RNA polymerase sigma factor [Bacteroidota bacterium]|nr:sigma-70 family RNA polymerase sigma factor [Bacteroidota bacterium]MEC8239044.1 sigma-70 family RNA polymerase sigma factor [Bacteroidota bacterium]MEC8637695.1 sigma-70 family RNA polymerase sigma factor [Bacteroidota bacterium]